MQILSFLAHLSRRLEGELLVYPYSGVCPLASVVHNFKHEYLCIQWADHNEILSEASLGWGKGCRRFWARSDPNSGFHGNKSHRVIMEKTVLPLFLSCFSSDLFSSPEPKSVCVSVGASTLSNIIISETSGPITTKFYLKQHWGGGKAASGFRPFWFPWQRIAPIGL